MRVWKGESRRGACLIRVMICFIQDLLLVYMAGTSNGFNTESTIGNQIIQMKIYNICIDYIYPHAILFLLRICLQQMTDVTASSPSNRV